MRRSLERMAGGVLVVLGIGLILVTAWRIAQEGFHLRVHRPALLGAFAAWLGHALWVGRWSRTDDGTSEVI